MNKEKLISLINNPTNISNEDLEALKKLADEYPYFQIAHTLIAKTLGDNKSLAFKNRLHYASITSPDRNILKKVIEGHAISYATSTAIDAPVKEEIKETAHKEEIKKEEVKEVESSADIVKERLAEIEGTKVKENLSDLAIPAVASADALKITDKATDNKLINELEENLKSLQKAKEKNIAEAKTKQAAKTAVKAKPSPKAKAKTVRKKITPTKKKVTTSKKAIAKSKVAVSKKATPKKTAVKKVATTKTPIKKVATRKTTANTKMTPVKKIANKKAASSKKITPKKVDVKKAPIKKVAAIKKVAPVKANTKKVVAKKTTKAKKATPVKATAKKVVSKKALTTRAKKTTVAKKKLPKKVSKTTTVTAQRKIIDAFIKKEPKIRPKKPLLKVKEKPQKDLSVESTKIKNDLVSENLAIIMEKQGKISKAKDIYKKLIWKFPQKKAYFATRIKELDKK